MFDILSNEDAEGDSKMMGSGRRVVVFGFITSEGLLAILVAAGCCAFLTVKGAAILRTCEKS